MQFYAWALLYSLCFLTYDSPTFKPKIPFQPNSILFHSTLNTTISITALFFNSINVCLVDKYFPAFCTNLGVQFRLDVLRLLAILHSKEIICPVTASVPSQLQGLNFSSGFSVPYTEAKCFKYYREWLPWRYSNGDILRRVSICLSIAVTSHVGAVLLFLLSY